MDVCTALEVQYYWCNLPEPQEIASVHRSKGYALPYVGKLGAVPWNVDGNHVRVRR